jgi:hypothetical protein
MPKGCGRRRTGRSRIDAQAVELAEEGTRRNPGAATFEAIALACAGWLTHPRSTKHCRSLAHSDEPARLRIIRSRDGAESACCGWLIRNDPPRPKDQTNPMEEELGRPGFHGDHGVGDAANFEPHSQSAARPAHP